METTIKKVFKAGQIVLAGWLIGIALVSCISSSQASSLQSDKPRLAPAASQDDLNALVSGNNDFAFDLYQAVKKEQDNLPPGAPLP